MQVSEYAHIINILQKVSIALKGSRRQHTALLYSKDWKVAAICKN